MKIKRLRNNLRPAQRLNLFFGLLVAASLLLLAFAIRDLLLAISRAPSLSQGLLGEWHAGASVLALLRSRLFQALVVGLAWFLWVATRRRQLDQIRLRRSEQKYRTIINHAGEAIFLLDRAGHVLEWNKAAEVLFGEPRRAVLGRFFRDIHVCYGVRIEGAMSDAVRLGRSLTFEFPFPRQDRRGGQISLTITAIAAPTGQGSGGEHVFVIIARDITSEKQLETKMSETEKLAGIGQLAAGIAHQLNTLIG